MGGSPTLIITAFFSIAILITGTDASIDCFKCVSNNGDNPMCDDPFHNNYTTDIYQTPCMTGRKDRNGLFPATACIKLNGYFLDNGDRITVRGCALDSGTLTTDTEIIRMSHCGGLVFKDRYVKGCLQSCDDIDGCNGVPSTTPSHVLQYFYLTVTLLQLILRT